MKEINITTRIQSVGYEELTEQDRWLVDAAREATKGSYAPFSNFHVGAALQLANGEIVCGANQENAAFSSGTCAERSTCFYAASRFPGVSFSTLAIAAETGGKFQAKPISPCGACRQALLEYETQFGDFRLLLYGEDEIYVVENVKSLLPLCFTEF